MIQQLQQELAQTRAELERQRSRGSSRSQTPHAAQQQQLFAAGVPFLQPSQIPMPPLQQSLPQSQAGMGQQQQDVRYTSDIRQQSVQKKRGAPVLRGGGAGGGQQGA